MSAIIKSFLMTSTLAFSLSMVACSKSVENSELDEIKQELAELKKEIAENSENDLEPGVQRPTADDVAFEKAVADGRVRAFGKYAKDFTGGKHLASADEGAWASASRQNSVAAYEAYRKYFPKGKNIQHSFTATLSAESQSANNALADLGYDITAFPDFGTFSIDKDGKIQKPKEEVRFNLQPKVDELAKTSSSKAYSIPSIAYISKENCYKLYGFEGTQNGKDICMFLIPAEGFQLEEAKAVPHETRKCLGGELKKAESGTLCMFPLKK